MSGRFEDILYIGNGIELFQWLRRYESRALYSMQPVISPITSPITSPWKVYIPKFKWNTYNEFRNVYIKFQSINDDISFVIVLSGYNFAKDYVYINANTFAELSILENMYKALQYRAIIAITDVIYSTDLFTYQGYIVYKDASLVNEWNPNGQIYISNYKYNNYEYNLTLHHEMPHTSTIYYLPHVAYYENIITKTQEYVHAYIDHIHTQESVINN